MINLKRYCMHCLIVDDDDTSRKVIESFVEQTDDLDLAGSFGNPQEALQFLKLVLVFSREIILH